MNDPIVLVDQPTLDPTRKWWSERFSGAAVAVCSGAAYQFAGITLPAGMEGSLVIVLGGLIAYFTRDRMPVLQVVQPLIVAHVPDPVVVQVTPKGDAS